MSLPSQDPHPALSGRASGNLGCGCTENVCARTCVRLEAVRTRLCVLAPFPGKPLLSSLRPGSLLLGPHEQGLGGSRTKGHMAQAYSLTPSRGLVAEWTRWSWVSSTSTCDKGPGLQRCGVCHRAGRVKPSETALPTRDLSFPICPRCRDSFPSHVIYKNKAEKLAKIPDANLGMKWACPDPASSPPGTPLLHALMISL